MKRLRTLSLALITALPLSGCCTDHLLSWANDEPSIYWEPEGEFSRGLVKPFVTVVGMPVAVAWDIVFFPFQVLSGTHPYGDSFMRPPTKPEDRIGL